MTPRQQWSHLGPWGGDNGVVSVEIRANTVLPARREAVTLHTADGLSLIGELARPEDREPLGTLVCLHPLPTHGGMMDSHLYRKAAFRLPALAGLAVLRFNTRGTASVQGRSDGEFDEGIGEEFDVRAAVRYAVDAGLPDRWLVGWSFGTELALRYGSRLDVTGAVLISPPLKRAGDDDVAAWAASGKPLVALVPEHDDYLQPPEARERFHAGYPSCEVIAFPGAKHLFVGNADAVLDAVVDAVLPGTAPLPRSWDGPSSTSTFSLVGG
jgi:alpha/beta superfamily hydrolase